MKRILVILALGLSFSLAACDEQEQKRNRSSIPPPEPSENIVDDLGKSIQTMAIRPAYKVLEGLGSTVQLTLDIWFWDETVVEDAEESFLNTEGENVTVSWSTDNYGIATVDASGLVTAVSSGDTFLRAFVGGHEALARIIVEAGSSNDPNIDVTEPPPPEEPPPPSGPTESPPSSPEAPYVDRVVSTISGTNGGFHRELLPDIVLGPPKGAGTYQGSFDVVSLGVGGSIVLEFTDYLIFDGDGVDFTVFENAFQIGGDPNNTFAEPGFVAVSEDGLNFVEFPCDPLNKPYLGCAGVQPTLANPDVNSIDPTDPAVSGGDSFDLADVGLKSARFVRIRDSGAGYGPIGPGTGGFDLDAVAVIHGTLPY